MTTLIPVETIEAVKLLACPICAGKCSYATVKYGHQTVKEQGWKQDVYHYVNCQECGLNNRGIVGFRTAEEAGDKWNTRASTPAAPEQTLFIDMDKPVFSTSINPLPDVESLRAAVVRLADAHVRIFKGSAYDLTWDSDGKDCGVANAALKADESTIAACRARSGEGA